MPDYLYRITPTRAAMLTDGPTPEEAEATQAHFAYLKEGVDEGRVLMAGRTLTKDEGTFGIVVFRAEDEEAAQTMVDDDPAVKAGVMSAQLFPFRLALLCKDWDMSGDKPPKPARVKGV